MRTQRLPTRWWLVVAAAAAGIGVATATSDAGEGSARELADRVLACTVGIRCRTAPWCEHVGSGFVVSPAGHVLTATSVVPAGASGVRVTFPNFVERDATVVLTDERLAVALLAVDATGLDFLPLARELPELGTTAYTAGDVEDALESGGRASFSRGLVSGIYDVPRGPESAYEGRCIETTAAVNPGSDGGPLVDAAGRACGVLLLGVHPTRWQGTAVPTAVLVERLAAYLPAPQPARPAAAGDDGLGEVARRMARSIVGIEVERKFPPEVLPRPSWDEYRGRIAGWDRLSAAEQEKRFDEYLGLARTLEVNQLLRRPRGQLTGVLVSPQGHVLTSLFNVADDTAAVVRATGRPRDYDVFAPAARLAAEPEGGLERRPNPVTGITVVLADGSRRPAVLHARHEPLGVALLTISPVDQPCLDLDGVAASPLVGDRVGIVGHLTGGRPDFTLNSGIVSAPARNRGYRFQTDALVNYGNSGGPVFDRAGSLLGIAVAPLEPETVLGRIVFQRQLQFWTRAPNSGVGLVARADRIRDALADLVSGRSFERVPGPFLGVQPDESRAFAAHVTIAAVTQGSPAERAGIKPGDVLVECDGVELRGWPDLTDRIAARQAGDTLELRVQRRGGGPRLLIAGREIATAADLEALKRSLRPGQTFEGVLSTDDSRTVSVVLEESR